MANEFFTWWGATLLEMVPARLSGQDASAQDALVVTQVEGQEDQVTLALRRAGRDRGLGTFGLGTFGLGTLGLGPATRLPPVALRWRRAIVLQLPGHRMLEREVVLPLAAERQVKEVLRFEIDRLTPFAAAELHWSCAIRRRDKARGRLHVHLALVTRAAAAPLLDALGHAGIPPTGIERAPSPDGTPEQAVARIDLRPEEAPPGPLARHTGRVLLSLCAVLLLAVIATPFVLQERAQARVDARIAALRPAVEAAEAARRRLAASTAGVDVIASTQARLGNTLAVLAAVTDLLPDGTSLTELTLRGGRLTLGGESNAAARLIGALSTDPLIRNPDFSAPVTRTGGGAADLFAIRAEIGP